MNDESEFKIVQSYFSYAVVGAFLTAAAAVLGFYAGEILVGLIPSALFIGIFDVMFRKILTTVNAGEKTITVEEYSLWRRPKLTMYQADEIEKITVDWLPGAAGPGLRHYQVSLRPKKGRKKRLKVLISKRKAEDLSYQLTCALQLRIKKEQDDWRLTNQEEYLKGVTLVRRKYRQYPENPEWDHDHCSFCWATFMVGGESGSLDEGYSTEDEYHWVCPQCFEDFKEAFEWSVKEE